MRKINFKKKKKKEFLHLRRRREWGRRDQKSRKRKGDWGAFCEVVVVMDKVGLQWRVGVERKEASKGKGKGKKAKRDGKKKL
mgnify:CR=1 FL=1